MTLCLARMYHDVFLPFSTGHKMKLLKCGLLHFPIRDPVALGVSGNCLGVCMLHASILLCACAHVCVCTRCAT